MTGDPYDIATALAETGLRWGVAARDVPALASGTGPAAIGAAADAIAAVGGRALLLGSARQASTSLDPGELRSARDRARAAGVELHVALGELHPLRFDPAAAADTVRAGAILDIVAYHVTIGRMPDRFATSPTWSSALTTVAATLRQWLPTAGRPIVVRTHEEMTTFELLALLDDVGDDRLQVGFSPVNVICRVEDPGSAWQRVATRSTVAYLDDFDLVRTPEGADRRLRPIGDGVVMWPGMLHELADRRGADAPATVFLDLAQAEFPVPFLDETWLAHQPDLSTAEFAKVIGLALPDGAPQSALEDRRARGWAILERASALAAGG